MPLNQSFELKTMGTSSAHAAFPGYLREAAADILATIATGERSHPSSSVLQRVLVHGEMLDIPRRVYYDADRIRAVIAQDGVQGRIALCLGTIHHDGYFRQECVERLLHDDQSWVLPFIINLVGEYVLEIIIRIERAMPMVNRQAYGEFLRNNPKWFATIERRVLSYWDVYYRKQFPQFAAYPGARVVAELRSLGQQSDSSFQRTDKRPLN